MLYFAYNRWSGERDGDTMLIEIDFNSEDAIYLQLRNQIVLMIARRELQNGEALPSVRQLAAEIGVNMHTVNKAYAMLRQEGYVQLDRRHGAVVSVECDKKLHVENVYSDMELFVAEAICKDISLRELQSLIEDVYSKINQ